MSSCNVQVKTDWPIHLVCRLNYTSPDPFHLGFMMCAKHRHNISECVNLAFCFIVRYQNNVINDTYSSFQLSLDKSSSTQSRNYNILIQKSKQTNHKSTDNCYLSTSLTVYPKVLPNIKDTDWNKVDILLLIDRGKS